MNIADFKHFDGNRITKKIWSRRDGKITKKTITALETDNTKMVDSKDKK